MKPHLLLAGVVLTTLAMQIPALLDAQSQGIQADYDRANSFPSRLSGKVIDVAEAPNWLSASQLWYRKSVKGGTEFVLVDAAAVAKKPAFDHARLAAALSVAAGASYTAQTLPFTSFTYVDNMQAIEFAIGAAPA